MPVNHGGKPFVVNGEGERSANTSPFGPLFSVERTPLRPSICKLGGDDKTATHTHDFGALIVSYESVATAFWALLNLCGLWEGRFSAHLLFLLLFIFGEEGIA